MPISPCFGFPRSHIIIHKHIHAHTHTHPPDTAPLNELSARRIGRYLHNTTQETNFHAFSGILTRGLRNQEGADLRLTLHGQMDRYLLVFMLPWRAKTAFNKRSVYGLDGRYHDPLLEWYLFIYFTPFRRFQDLKTHSQSRFIQVPVAVAGIELMEHKDDQLIQWNQTF